MPLFGLIGYPLSHSLSEKIFTEKFAEHGLTNHHYQLFPLNNISQLTDLIRSHPDLQGLNVTIPYKEAIIPFLNELDTEAKDIGAANTIWIIRNKGKIFLKGFNTDHSAFYQSIKKFILPRHQHALIIGTGGASKAVAYVFRRMAIKYLFVSRNPASGNQLSYSQIGKAVIRDHQMIVNATPLGMFPDIQSYPDIPYQFLTPEHLVADLVYNPEKTVFLKKSGAMGAVTLNGLEMLYVQSEKSWELWQIP